MKKLLITLFLTVMLFPCQGLSYFDNVYQGHAIEKPINIQKLKLSIQFSLAKYNWNIISASEGRVIAKFEKEHGKINATIQIDYSQEGYSIKYIGSKNLKVNLKEMKIHSNYVRWIRNLIKSINLFYYKEAL